MHHYTRTAAIMTLVAPLSATYGQDALGIDDFNDGSIGSMWTAATYGTQQVSETNGRLEFPAWAGSGQSVGGIVGTGWQLALDRDFIVHAKVNMQLPNPGDWSGYGIGILLTANASEPLAGQFNTGVLFYRGWEGDELIEGYEVRRNGIVIAEDWSYSYAGARTTYIGYDASWDAVGMDDNSSFSDPWVYEGLSSLLGPNVTMSVVAIRQGSLGATSGRQLWIDDASISMGHLTGNSVGACCLGDTCTTMLESGCTAAAGSWQGAGTSCSDVNCGDDDPETCTGDVNSSGEVDATDLHALLSAFGTSNATSDLDSNGRVDIRDLLIMLKAWGPCENSI